MRLHDIIGGLSLAVWVAMLALVAFARVAIPDWPPPDVPYGTALPPPDGCRHEIDRNLSTSRYVCTGIPAGWLIGEALNYADAWVFGPFVFPIFLFPSPLWLFPDLWLTVLPSVLSLGFAVCFVLRRLVRRRAARVTGNPKGGLR